MGAALLAVVAARPLLALSAPEENEALRREFDTLFEQTLARPSDLDLAFRYAAVAVQLGDLEAAIGALERMLIYDPNLPRVRLELGVLYYRLGSFAVSRRYFEQAVEGGDVPLEVRARVAGYLAELDRLSSRHQYAGQVFFGAQSQSNANVAPASARIRAIGLDATLSDQFVKKSDQNLFATGTLLYSYDLETQQRDRIEVAATAFDSFYFREKRLNLGLAEVTAGPRLSPFDPITEGNTVKPYAIANYVALGDDPFFHTFGAGVETTWAVLPSLLVKPIYEHRIKNFQDAPDRPTSRQFNGEDDIMSLAVSWAPDARSIITVAGNTINQNTRTGFTSNDEWGVTLGGQIAYAPPIGPADAPWTTSLIAGRSVTDYRAPDPSVDPDVKRHDRRWRFGMAQNISVTSSVDLVIQLQRDVVSSNLPNFAYTNSSILVGPQIRF